MKILGSNIQKPIEELDILDRVRAALRTVIIPPQSQETLGAIDNAKGKRRRIQSSSGEVLTEEEVMSRLEAQSIRRHANKRTLSKKSKSSLSNVPMTSLLSSIPENDFPSQCSIMDVPKDGNCFFSCISLGLYNKINRELVSGIRSRVVKFIVDHWSDYSMTIAIAHDVHSPQDYAAYMEANGVLVDEAEVSACARCYEICITILSGPSFTTHRHSTFGSNYSSKNVVKLHLQFQHYRLIKDNLEESVPRQKSAQCREKRVAQISSSDSSDSEIPMPPPMKKPTASVQVAKQSVIEITPSPNFQSSRSRCIRRPSRFSR